MNQIVATRLKAEDVTGRSGGVWAVFAALVLFAAVIRFVAAREPALWFDEAFSVYYVQKSLGDIWGADWRLEPTPPLYYTALHFWTRLFGSEEFALRSLSLIFSSLATGVIYLAGLELRSRLAGAIAAFIWALIPLSIEYGVEMRAYALEFLGIAVTLLLLIRTVRRIEHGLIASKGEFAGHAAMLAAAGLFISYTHITAVLVFASFSAVFAAYLLFRNRRTRSYFWIWTLLNVVYLIGFTPQIYASYMVMTTNAPTLAWLVPPNLMDILAIARALLVGNSPWGDTGPRLALAAWVLVGSISLYGLRRDPLAIALTLGVCAMGAAFFVGFSRFQPILLNRTMFWLTIPAVVFLGAALSSLRPRVAMPAVLVLAVACVSSARMSRAELREMRGDHAGITEVASRLGAKDLIVTVDGELACEVHFYARHVYPAVRLADIDGREFVRTQRVDLSCNLPPAETISSMKQDLASGRNIWVIGRMPFYENGARMRRDVDRIVGDLKGSAREVGRIQNRSFVAIGLGPN